MAIITRCSNRSILLAHLLGILEDASGCGQFAVDAPIWCFEEAHFVDTRIGGHRTNQADVGTFGGLHRADTPVVRVVHVADFEAGTVAAQTTRTECRQTALVGELGQRIGLIHEL
ncbi:MAG: hypothetical protein RL076_880 [Chloroflexota bacterium]